MKKSQLWKSSKAEIHNHMSFSFNMMQLGNENAFRIKTNDQNSILDKNQIQKNHNWKQEKAIPEYLGKGRDDEQRWPQYACLRLVANGTRVFFTKNSFEIIKSSTCSMKWAPIQYNSHYRWYIYLMLCLSKCWWLI